MEASGAPSVRWSLRGKKKYKHTTSTAALFQSRNFQPKTSKLIATARTRNFQPKPSKLSTATTVTSFSPSKHDPTSKPQGVRKRQGKPNAPHGRQRSKIARQKLHTPLSLEFNEASDAYRKTVVSNAETLLRSARAAMLTRLDEINDGPSTPCTPVKRNSTRTAPRPFLAASPASNDDDETDDVNDTQDRTPTLSELCYAHTMEVAKLIQPFADEEVEYVAEPEHDLTARKKRIGDSMEAFRRLVAKEEKTLAALEDEWDAVQAEINRLAKSILQSVRRDDANGAAAGAKIKMDKTPAVDAAVVERLKREVVEAADEFDSRVDETQEAEKALKRRQERFLADTIRSMGDL